MFYYYVTLHTVYTHTVCMLYIICRCEATANASLNLMTFLFTKLKKVYKRYVKVLKMSISVVLFTLVKLNQRQVAKDKVSEAFRLCEQSLREWIVLGDVVGGSFFGGTSKAKTEIEV